MISTSLPSFLTSPIILATISIFPVLYNFTSVFATSKTDTESGFEISPIDTSAVNVPPGKRAKGSVFTNRL